MSQSNEQNNVIIRKSIRIKIVHKDCVYLIARFGITLITGHCGAL